MKKKLLLGTTALIVAGFATSGVVQAAEEPISAGIGGYYRTAMGMVSQDDEDGEFADGAHSTALAQDIEISVSGSTTLDNGITVGFNAMIEGNTVSTSESSALDERHVFFRGGFGEINVGSIESVRQQMTNFAPNGNFNFGVNTPFFVFANPGNAAGIFNVRTFNDGLGVEDSLKLVYFSPTFNGFRLGVSYAPDDDEFGQYGQNTKEDAGELSNQVSASLEFSQDFGDFNLRVMAAHESYNLELCNVNAAGAAVAAAAPNIQNCEDSPESVQFGGTVSFGEFAIGGGYLESDQVGNTSTGSGRSREDWDVGIAWWSGAYGVGLQYGSAELDQADNTTDELTIMELNGTYVLGPGIDIGAGIATGEFEDGTANANGNDYTEFKIGAALNF